jgi:hypothetical protein
MSFWGELSNWFRTLFEPTTPVSAGDVPPVLHPRVLVITFNPVIRAEGDRKLTEVMGWRNVDQLCQDYISDLQQTSSGFLNYEIVQKIESDLWPVKKDGFRYGEASFLRHWRGRGNWHQPDAVDYQPILDDYDLLQRVDSGLIDEVWLFGFPYAGFYESLMVGPGAFWCNSPPLERTTGISRRFVIMGFNYERGVGPMLESFGHRVESHLKHTWRRKHGQDNLWKQFILYDKQAPGQANCGWMHYAPNSLTDYDWGNTTFVRSNCDDWLNFPNFQGTYRNVNCGDWGNGDMRAHHKWWFERLPNAPGETHGIANNWWWYGVDPNVVR